MTRVYPLLALITLFNTAYAQDQNYLPDAKLTPESARMWVQESLNSWCI